jgi:hypothetical protein
MFQYYCINVKCLLTFVSSVSTLLQWNVGIRTVLSEKACTCVCCPLQARWHPFEAPIKIALSFRLFLWSVSRTADRIFMTFFIGRFCCNLICLHSFGARRKTVTDTLDEACACSSAHLWRNCCVSEMFIVTKHFWKKHCKEKQGTHFMPDTLQVVWLST